MPSIAPPFLYKYKSLVDEEDLLRTIEIIWSNRIFASPLDNLNDPMEGKGVVPGSGFAGISRLRAIGRLPSRFNTGLESCRVLSLSETPVSPQMWTYYGGCYKGVCLRFGRLPFVVEPVRYAPRPYMVGDLAAASRDNFDVTKARLLTKHSDWSHELEWRAVFREGEGPLVEIGDDNPCAVIVGHKCEESAVHEIKSACTRRGIHLYKTYLADWEFRVRIVPFGFEPEYSGLALDTQVVRYCSKEGVPVFGEY